MHNHNNSHHSHHQPSKINEGLEAGDLIRLVDTEIGIDQFVSKMGDDSDIIVVSFKVGGEEPATDLMNFIERGYDWVLDADVSPGELDSGDYVVFVELERTPRAAQHITSLVEDIVRLTDEPITGWTGVYNKDEKTFAITPRAIAAAIPTTPEEYHARFGDGDDEEYQRELEAMMETARVPMRKKTHRRDDDMDRLRSQAGLL
jgi:hypothetical protein